MCPVEYSAPVLASVSSRPEVSSTELEPEAQYLESAATELAPAQRGRLDPRTVAQWLTSALLVGALAFLVVSNYVGWTAVIPVTSVVQRCQGQACYQVLALDGSDRQFRIEAGLHVEPGDLAEVHAQCTPRCQLEVVGIQRAVSPMGR